MLCNLEVQKADSEVAVTLSSVELSSFAQFYHRYFVFTLIIALTSLKQMFSFIHVDG